MPFLCRHKLPGTARSAAPTTRRTRRAVAFEYVRVERPEDLPAADPRIVDVAVLDMNHGWPNLGHDCLVHALLDAACELLPVAAATGLRVRALSFDVRRAGMIPEPPGGRFSLYLGTGGPGHIDPLRRTTASPRAARASARTPPGRRRSSSCSTRILRGRERGAARRLPHLRRDVPLVGARRAGAARPREGGQEHRRAGERARPPRPAEHPWFRRFGEELADGGRLRILDNRLFDLIPRAGAASRRAPCPSAGRPWGSAARAGDAITMIEFARDPAACMPRVFGVNHHPGDRRPRRASSPSSQQKLERGEVSAQWVAERRES